MNMSRSLTSIQAADLRDHIWRLRHRMETGDKAAADLLDAALDALSWGEPECALRILTEGVPSWWR